MARRLAVVASVMLILGLCAPLLAAGQAGAASSTKNQSPWGGFALEDTSPKNLTMAAGSWVVPQVTCRAGETSYAAEWVGLGGDFYSFFQKILGDLGDSKRFEPLYQAGTDTDCSNGKPIYDAWEEVYAPGQDKPSITLKGAVVQPGDTVSVSLSFDAKKHTGTWLVTDSRAGAQVWSRPGSWSSTPAGFHTAECIVEDPLLPKGRAPLADFSTTTFGGCHASSSAGQATVTSATLPGHWSHKTLNMKIGSNVLAVAAYNPLRVVHGSSASPPVLGALYRSEATGFGSAAPATVQYGGDGYSQATGVTWSSWGQSQATGTGTGWYVSADESQDQGSKAPITLVAFGLGTCGAGPAYTRLAWYFPSNGGSFDPSYYLNACTGMITLPPTPTTTTTTEATAAAPCDVNQLATAATAYESANGDPDGSGSIISGYVCDGAYAATSYTPGNDPGTGAAMAFSWNGSAWQVLGEGNLVPPNVGIPSDVYSVLENGMANPTPANVGF